MGSSLATQQYKVHPHRMKTEEVADLSGGSTLVEFYLMANYSTTARCIPILFAGGCWAHRQLHAGIRLIPMPLIFMKLPYPGERLGEGGGYPAPVEAMSEGCPAPVEAMSEVMPVFRYSTSISFNRLF